MSKKRPGVTSTSRNDQTKKLKTAKGTLDSFFSSPNKSKSEPSRSSTSPRSRGKGLFRDDPLILDDDDDIHDTEAPPAVVIGDDTPFAKVDTGDAKRLVSASGSGSKISFPSLSAVESHSSLSGEPPGAFPDLGVDPLEFQVPSHPWTAKTAPYSFLSHVLEMLSQTRSLSLMLNTLTNALRVLILHDTNSIVPSMYMISNSLAPSYVPAELGLGPMIITKALQAVSGLSGAALRKVSV